MGVQEILAPLMAYEQWLEETHEGFAEAVKGYKQASKAQREAQDLQESERWQVVRLAYADEMAKIREEMKDTYESR
jgi:ABC-type phosphate/phosphonate transport system substrate-binding protein